MPINCNSKITLTDLQVTPGAKKQTAFRTIQQRYGDGYTARRQDGINPVIETWNVSTPPMPVCDVEALEQELIANGPNYISWCAPNESKASSWGFGSAVRPPMELSGHSRGQFGIPNT